MPRFHIVAFDPADNTYCSQIGRFNSAVEAVCYLPWLEEIYRPSWIIKNIQADDLDSTISNCFQRLGWIVLCVNLDEEIMKDLNGGDSNVSFPMQHN